MPVGNNSLAVRAGLAFDYTHNDPDISLVFPDAFSQNFVNLVIWWKGLSSSKAWHQDCEGRQRDRGSLEVHKHAPHSLRCAESSIWIQIVCSLAWSAPFSVFHRRKQRQPNYRWTCEPSFRLALNFSCLDARETNTSKQA